MLYPAIHVANVYALQKLSTTKLLLWPSISLCWIGHVLLIHFSVRIVGPVLIATCAELAVRF